MGRPRPGWVRPPLPVSVRWGWMGVNTGGQPQNGPRRVFLNLPEGSCCSQHLWLCPRVSLRLSCGRARLGRNGLVLGAWRGGVGPGVCGAWLPHRHADVRHESLDVRAPPRPRRTLSPACTVGRGALKSWPLHSVPFTLLPSKFISELIAPSELLKLCFVRDAQRDINEKAPVCPAAPPTRGVNRWARALARQGPTPLGPLSGGDHRLEAGGLYPRALA